MAEPESVYGSQLGRYMDGWADLIEGMGTEAERIRALVLGDLNERNMPDVEVRDVHMEEGFITFKKHREYVITTTFPGVTTTINVARHGTDLFASWRTYIRTTINWEFMAVYCGIAVILAIVINHLIQGSSLAMLSPVGTDSRDLLGDLKSAGMMALSWVGTAFGIYVVLVFLETSVESSEKQNLSVFRQLRRKLLTVLQNHPDFIPNSELRKRLLASYLLLSLMLAFFVLVMFGGFRVANDSVSLWEYGKSLLGPIVLYAIPVFLSILIVAIFAGILFKQNIFAFILKEPSVFDQEDIAAMSLTVHKTLLRALDTAGIDVSKLRLKGEFRAGRRGEKI